MQHINAAYDATECPIKSPLDYDTQLNYFSGKEKQHTIKYEIATEINTGQIVWLTGGYPGSIHDITITRLSSILQHLFPGEILIADKGYIGEGDHILTPFRKPTTDYEQYINSEIYRRRIIVENTIGRIKKFGCLQQSWRQDLSLHEVAFRVICNIVNIDIGIRPLRK